MNKIIIADITSLRNGENSFGHFFQVADMYRDIFGCNNTIVAGGPVYRKKYHLVYALKYDVDLKELEGTISRIVCKAKEVINCINVLRRLNKDFIIFQDYSNTSLFLGILLCKTKSKLFLIQYKSEVEKFYRKFLFSLIRDRISGIIVPNKKVGEKYKVPYLVVPDYIYTHDKFPEKKEAYEYDYGVFGIIREGKDVVGVAMKFIGSKKKIIIAGSVQSKILLEKLTEISINNKNIIFINKYLSQKEYKFYFNNTRVIILPYTDDYYEDASSGVVFDILFAGKPVIARRFPVFSFIKEKELGLLYDKLEEINFENLWSREEYSKFQKNIEKYICINRDNKKRLVNFISEGN